MSRFQFHPTAVAGVTEIERQRLGDTRGFLSRVYCTESFANAGCPLLVRQINHSFTAQRGSVRGLHLQRPPHAEIKLVSCVRGAVFDLALDLRRDSPSFLRWHGCELSAENRRALYIPAGCAHGFQSLSEECELVYLHSADYQPGAEIGIDALDPQLAIPWPLAIGERSPRDRNFAALQPDDDRYQ